MDKSGWKRIQYIAIFKLKYTVYVFIRFCPFVCARKNVYVFSS